MIITNFTLASAAVVAMTASPALATADQIIETMSIQGYGIVTEYYSDIGCDVEYWGPCEPWSGEPEFYIGQKFNFSLEARFTNGGNLLINGNGRIETDDFYFASIGWSLSPYGDLTYTTIMFSDGNPTSGIISNFVMGGQGGPCAVWGRGMEFAGRVATLRGSACNDRSDYGSDYWDQRYVATGWITDVWVNGVRVPEPLSWAMMVAGFGLAGTSLRRQRRLQPPVEVELRV